MGIIGALVIALIMALIFSPYKKGNSLMPLVVLFMVLFLAGYAAQFWIVPFGPIMWGVSWFPVLLVILIFALLFSTPPSHRRTQSAGTTEVNVPVVAISVFVWILLLILIAAIVIGIFYPHSFNQLIQNNSSKT